MCALTSDKTLWVFIGIYVYTSWLCFNYWVRAKREMDRCHSYLRTPMNQVYYEA